MYGLKQLMLEKYGLGEYFSICLNVQRIRDRDPMGSLSSLDIQLRDYISNNSRAPLHQCRM
jgi:hypothetical protein